MSKEPSLSRESLFHVAGHVEQVELVKPSLVDYMERPCPVVNSQSDADAAWPIEQQVLVDRIMLQCEQYMPVSPVALRLLGQFIKAVLVVSPYGAEGFCERSIEPVRLELGAKKTWRFVKLAFGRPCRRNQA